MLPHAAGRESAAENWSGYATFAAAAASVALHAWLLQGVFVPLAIADAVEYVFISASAALFFAAALVSLVVLAMAHLVVRRLGARQRMQPPLLSPQDVAYMRPLWWFAVSALGLLNLVRPHHSFLAVLSYVIVDLRWWWSAALVLWLAREIDMRSSSAGRTWLVGLQQHRTGVRRWTPEVAIAIITIAWAVCGTPILRFYGGTIGDEPKYVRYCENLYQGLGFEISEIRPMAELPADFRPRLWRNVALFASIVPGELRALASDAVDYVRNPSRAFNRARHREGGFLDGKNGGLYQVHGPGLSLLMFPAYYLDRAFADIEPGSPAQWPVHLRAVNAFFVGIYAAWTILIFRFLRRCGADTDIAFLASLAATLPLPASAFPFQYYPELAAGLFISAVCGHVLFGDRDRPGRSFSFGLLAGYLPWFHVRFTVVMVALVVGPLVLWRGEWRRLAAFVAGVAVPAALFSLYAYHITGSVLPSAVWTAEGSGSNFNLVGMVKNSVGYLLDREWGLFAHSPVFLLALPGYWWMARRQPRVVFLSTMVFLALLLPAAGKTLVQTTPMRLIAAVVPLGATPMIELLARRTRAIAIAFGLLLVLSLDVALSYNLHHYRHLDTLFDWSFSGWKVNLLFPRESRQPWQISSANGWLLVAWMIAAVGLVCAPALARWAGERLIIATSVTVPRRSTVVQVVAAVVAFVLLGTAVSGATGVWAGPRYLLPRPDAAQQAAFQLDDVGQCTLCLSSVSGALNARRMLAALTAIEPAVATRRRPDARPGYDDWVAMPGQIRAWVMEAEGRAPSDAEIGHRMYQWSEDHVPANEIRRQIFVAAGKTP